MKTYHVREKETTVTIDCFNEYSEAKKFIEEIVEMDKKDGYSTENLYEIVEKEEHTILDTIISKIKSGRFNFENVMKKGSYYGKDCNVMPLFCSYGLIGYKIFVGQDMIEVDLELNKINLYTD